MFKLLDLCLILLFFSLLLFQINELFIKLNNLTKYVGGAQIWSKVVSDANGGAHKIYNAITHAMLCKRAKKKYICTDTGAGYNGKMFSMVAKKFGLGCKVFMGTRDIERQKPN